MQKVYKYCTSDVYETYISKGFLQLGSLEKYRKDYEKGVGYADESEGLLIESVNGGFDSAKDHYLTQKLLDRVPGFNLSGRMISHGNGRDDVRIQTAFNAYIFSTALDYSISSHKKWFDRQGCGYDKCISFDMHGLISKIDESSKALPIPYIVGGRPVEYVDKKIDLRKNNVENRAMFACFTKPQAFSWEEEFRYIASGNKSDSQEHLRLEVNAINEVILDVIDI